jgi:hypothetical protein
MTQVYYKAAKECIDPDTGAVMLRPLNSAHAYEVGHTYKLDSAPELCRYGFHACTHPAAILLHREFGYTIHDALLKVDLGPASGIVYDNIKAASCTMTVLSRVAWPEALAESGNWRGAAYTFDTDGLLHSEGDLPAVTGPTGHGGTVEWWRHGQRHRGSDLPACVERNGLGQYYYTNGVLHREGDLPAVERWWNQEWYWKGTLHRVGAPAVVRKDGTQEWWEHGIRLK